MDRGLSRRWRECQMILKTIKAVLTCCHMSALKSFTLSNHVLSIHIVTYLMLFNLFLMSFWKHGSCQQDSYSFRVFDVFAYCYNGSCQQDSYMLSYVQLGPCFLQQKLALSSKMLQDVVASMKFKKSILTQDTYSTESNPTSPELLL